MIDKEKLKPVLAGYKKYFPIHWEDEKYKWEAVKQFRDHWNIDADNFGEMFKQATDKTYNLLASGYAYPRAMITNFAKADDEAVCRMFRELYDESRDIAGRAEAFQNASENLRIRYDDGTWKKHYQDINAISTYLWLMFPDKYYIYKYELARNAAKLLGDSYRPKRNGAVDNLIGGYRMYDEICEAIQADEAIKTMLHTAFTDTCYPDPCLKTVTCDVCFYLSRFYLEEQKKEQEEGSWMPKDYSPELTVGDWVELLENASVFTLNALQIVKRMKDYGGQATCKQLSIKYGEVPNFYNGGSQALARRVAEETGCPVMMRDTESLKWWPVLYTGKRADSDTDGQFIWRLRQELSDALDKVDLTDVPLYAASEPSIWKISHGTEATGISDTNKIIFENRKVAVVRSTTKAKARSKITQGQAFMNEVKKGDYFYLCYGNSVQLLGQFTSDTPVPNPEMQDGWYEREYRLIRKSKNTDGYTGIQKWWTPNNNSTCIKGDENDKSLFEELILQPYFDMSIEELFGASGRRCGYWWLTANPKI